MLKSKQRGGQQEEHDFVSLTMSQNSLSCLPDRFNKLHSRIFKMSRLTDMQSHGGILSCGLCSCYLYRNSSSQQYKAIITNATSGVQAVLHIFLCKFCSFPNQLQHSSFAFDRARGHHRRSWSINQATCRRTHVACMVQGEGLKALWTERNLAQ